MHGLAHVDTPKGDLDGSGTVIAPDTGVVIDNSFQYPYGTTEQFPQMEDSDLNELSNSAHYYMECSNKGICDRSTGTCECFDGYDGVACQRASCPGYPASCSGHGVCKTAAQLAASDGGNVYKLWNKDATMGCECDAGYYGPDCSQRHCKVGVDPLYLDDTSTVKYSTYDMAMLTTASTAAFDDGTPGSTAGSFAIRFYDHTGEDWVTDPLTSGASCDDVIDALEALPNNVIPPGETLCTRTSKTNTADNVFIGQDFAPGSTQSSSSSADYRITYRMSIWDAYIFKKFGSQYQDVLSVKSKLGNQVYSPLLWLPGSVTLPYADDVHAKTLSAGTADITGVALNGAVLEFTHAPFTMDSVDLLALAQNRLIEVKDGSVGSCPSGLKGIYSLHSSVSPVSATSTIIPVQESVDASVYSGYTSASCGFDIFSFALLGSANPMLSTTGFTATNNEYALNAVADGDLVLTLTGTDDLNTVDAQTVTNRENVIVYVMYANGGAATDCQIENPYLEVAATAIASTGPTVINIQEPVVMTADSTDTKCAVKLVASSSSNPLPESSTRVTMSGYIYRLKFFGNPGYLKAPEIVTHLDGKRNSLMSTAYSSSSTGEPDTKDLVITKTWTDGQQGEDKDYFADHCDGVTVTIHIHDLHEDPNLLGQSPTSYTDANAVYGDANYYLNAKWTLSMDSAETALLKTCLGDADLTTTNNVEIHDWDYGSVDYPHLIKLVRTVTTYTDGGYYVAIYWDSTNSNFVMVNPFTPPDALLTDAYEVYTTKGTLARVSAKAQAYFGFGQKTVITTHAGAYGTEHGWDGDVSCEVGDNNGRKMILPTDASAASRLDSGSVPFIADLDTTVEGTSANPTNTYVKACLNKTDIITFLNWEMPTTNSPKINLYTVKRLVKDKVHFDLNFRYKADGSDAPGHGAHPDILKKAGEDMTFGTNLIELDMATNWAVELANTEAATKNEVYIYKFIPHAESTYEYVAECSNRGLCDTETGTCECFAGYTDDACQMQSSLSL